jgi:hypothetical protein
VPSAIVSESEVVVANPAWFGAAPGATKEPLEPGRDPA